MGLRPIGLPQGLTEPSATALTTLMRPTVFSTRRRRDLGASSKPWLDSASIPHCWQSWLRSRERMTTVRLEKCRSNGSRSGSWDLPRPTKSTPMFAAANGSAACESYWQSI